MNEMELTFVDSKLHSMSPTQRLQQLSELRVFIEVSNTRQRDFLLNTLSSIHNESEKPTTPAQRESNSSDSLDSIVKCLEEIRGTYKQQNSLVFSALLNLHTQCNLNKQQALIV